MEELCGEEIESVRVKPVGEEGYVESKWVNSARKRVLEVEKRKKAQAQATAIGELDKMSLKEADETRSKEIHIRLSMSLTDGKLYYSLNDRV